MPNIADLEEDLTLTMDEINFNGKVAIITGAGRGLGRTYALELSKRGAKVVVNDVGANKDGLGEKFDCADKVVSEIRNLGGQAEANYDTVSTIEGGFNIFKTAIDNFGTVDIIINNAGIIIDRSFAKMTFNAWKSVLDVHINGAYNVTRPAFDIMKSKKYGRIIMTTSAAGLYGNFGQSNYSTAKMALIGMMNSLKLEGKKYNITINSIAPISASRLTKNIMPDDIFDKAKPNFVASLVLYLCSEGCLDSGNIYNVGMGYISRAAILTSSWTKIFSNDTNICKPEVICKEWSNINNMKESTEFNDLGSIFLDLIEGYDK